MNTAPVAAVSLSADDLAFLDQQERTRRSHPGNRSARFATRELLDALSVEQRATLLRCCRSGVIELDSEVGCYLTGADDLRELRAFFDPLMRDYHRAPVSASHVTDWTMTAVAADAMNFANLGVPPLSMRMRVARNLDGFSLPASMSRLDRVRLEQQMVIALQALIDAPGYGGRVYSLTPDFGPGAANPNLVTEAEYQALITAHLMFKNMEQDRYMRSAGIASDWPYGRACYVSSDREVIVWIGEEDHLRIICMKTGTDLRNLFERLRDAMGVIESLPGMRFAFDGQFGYVTSCPSNLGTGMRASLHISLPRLMQSGVDLREMCDHVGLSVCGPGGDRTPILQGGLLELSPTRRAFVRERDIVRKLYEGVRQLALWDAA